MLGSSPLARGTPQRQGRSRLIRGLIPARAGNTRPLFGHDQGTGAHPRSRGEHRRSIGHLLPLAGSSPLARGTRGQGRVRKCPAGLIPARAGNTGPCSRSSPMGRAHPRSRGEHQTAPLTISTRSGSSPLARGTPGHHLVTVAIDGLIPARAGNTLYYCRFSCYNWAHPRSRGEHPQ